MGINTVETIIDDFRNGQNIFRRPSVELLVREVSRQKEHISDLEDRIDELQNHLVLTEGDLADAAGIDPNAYEKLSNERDEAHRRITEIERDNQLLKTKLSEIKRFFSSFGFWDNLEDDEYNNA